MWRTTVIGSIRRQPSYYCNKPLRQRHTPFHSSAPSRADVAPSVKTFLLELEKDPSLFGKLWDTASKEARQEMVKPLVRSLASGEFKKADQNNDGVLSAREFQHWLTNSLKRTSLSVKATAGSSAASTVEVSRDQLKKLALVSAIPFVGFGFLDNALMILSGSQIEHAFSSFGISAMAAAALGNTLSDVAGIQAGGVIEAMAAKMGLPDPNLTLEQIKSPIVKRVTVISSAVGITIGCLLGMLPLLFIHEEDHKHDLR